MVLHDLGIKDINNVEKYDLNFIEGMTGFINDLTSGKLTADDFTREELCCLSVLGYAHDFYACGKGADSPLVSFDKADDENMALAGTMTGLILSAQFNTEFTPEQNGELILKKLAAYIYIRAYNRIKAEGTLMSVRAIPGYEVLNVWDSETEKVCSIDVIDIAAEILNGFFSSESMFEADEETSDEEAAAEDVEVSDSDTENEDDEDGSSPFMMIGVPDIDGMLTDVLNAHNPEIPDCHKVSCTDLNTKVS